MQMQQNQNKVSLACLGSQRCTIGEPRTAPDHKNKDAEHRLKKVDKQKIIARPEPQTKKKIKGKKPQGMPSTNLKWKNKEQGWPYDLKKRRKKKSSTPGKRSIAHWKNVLWSPLLQQSNIASKATRAFQRSTSLKPERRKTEFDSNNARRQSRIWPLGDSWLSVKYHNFELIINI